MIDDQPPPSDGNDRDNLTAISRYLGLAADVADMRRITGLSSSTIENILAGATIDDADRSRHVEVVAGIVRSLSAARLASAGSSERSPGSSGWLHTGSIATLRGLRTPIEVLSDPVLAAEALVVLHL